jgi:uncharacterized protein YegP (UPF0339 family)
LRRREAVNDRVQIYEDEAGEWRWRRIAPNGEIVSESGEGYTERNDAREAALRVNDGRLLDSEPPNG